jgi:hypothetical protein
MNWDRYTQNSIQDYAATDRGSVPVNCLMGHLPVIELAQFGVFTRQTSLFMFTYFMFSSGLVEFSSQCSLEPRIFLRRFASHRINLSHGALICLNLWVFYGYKHLCYLGLASQLPIRLFVNPPVIRSSVAIKWPRIFQSIG